MDEQMVINRICSFVVGLLRLLLFLVVMASIVPVKSTINHQSTPGHELATTTHFGA
jgi:hypothetical protein